MNKKNGLTGHDIGKTRRLLLSFHFCMLRQEWLRLIQLFCFNLFSSISLFQEELIFFCSPWWDICTRNWVEWCVFSSEQALLFGQVKRVSRERESARARERAAKPRGPSLARSREARVACPNRRACSQALFSKKTADNTGGALAASPLARAFSRDSFHLPK